MFVVVLFNSQIVSRKMLLDLRVPLESKEDLEAVESFEDREGSWVESRTVSTSPPQNTTTSLTSGWPGLKFTLNCLSVRRYTPSQEPGRMHKQVFHYRISFCVHDMFDKPGRLVYVGRMSPRVMLAALVTSCLSGGYPPPSSVRQEHPLRLDWNIQWSFPWKESFWKQGRRRRNIGLGHLFNCRVVLVEPFHCRTHSAALNPLRDHHSTPAS